MSKFRNFSCLCLCLNSVAQADQKMNVVSVNNPPELKSSTMSSLGWSAFNAVISLGGQKGLQKLGYDINPFWIFCGLELFKQIALSTATNRANQEIVNKNNSDLQNRLNSANRQAEQLRQQLGDANEAKDQAEQLQEELNKAKENAEKQLVEANEQAEQLQKELNEANGKAEQLQKELNEAKENAEKQLVEANEAKAKVEQQAMELKQQLNEANEKAEQLQKQLDFQKNSKSPLDTSNNKDILVNELMMSGS